MSHSIQAWGNIVWFMFHTVAHRIKEFEFASAKPDLILLIKTVCANLPCPECSQDANDILKQINFDIINTKQEFKQFLFNFHNYVNKKTGKQAFALANLDEKYGKANLNAIFSNFFIVFSQKSNVPQMMSASFYRKQAIPKIRDIINRLSVYLA